MRFMSLNYLLCGLIISGLGCATERGAYSTSKDEQTNNPAGPNEVLGCSETTVVGVPKHSATATVQGDGSLEVKVHDTTVTPPELVERFPSCTGGIPNKDLNCINTESLVPEGPRTIFSMSSAPDGIDAVYLQQDGLSEPESTIYFDCAESIAL